jgi:alkylhydroperoxidase/carboxymuconolactone decarboxylase family protein YurZ
MMQIVAYCGAPAGINARKAVLQMRAEEAAGG